MKSWPESVKITVRVAFESESISIRVSGWRDPKKQRLMSTNNMLTPLFKGPSCFSDVVSVASAGGSGLLKERHPFEDRT
jgi:hypothetical protein